jgi:PleD family two-component response regulator
MLSRIAALMFTYQGDERNGSDGSGEKRAARPKRRSKILIVDDDADLCHALGLRLRANHYETLSTGDGYSALALAQ